MLVGILPLPRPDKMSALKGIRIEGKANYKKLEELIGNEISVNDNHGRDIKSKLIYLSNTNNYSILTNKGIKYMKVHDLQSIAH